MKISLEALKVNSREVTAAVKRQGGVTVVDANGAELFRLSIPNKPLPDDFRRGAIAAAAVATDYVTTHPYRLDDCILGKLNLRDAKPRKNRRQLPAQDVAWNRGVATALAEIHRRLLQGNDSTSVRAVASTCGLTMALAKKIGISPYDLKELRKAGVQ